MRGRAGFTLVEALVAMALGAVLAASVANVVTSLAAALRLAASARTLAETLRWARGHAIAEGMPLEAQLDATTGTWTVRTIAGVVRERGALPAPVTFGALPASATVRFGSTGTATNGTIVLTAIGRSRSIIVNQRGRVRLS